MEYEGDSDVNRYRVSWNNPSKSGNVTGTTHMVILKSTKIAK